MKRVRPRPKTELSRLRDHVDRLVDGRWTSLRKWPRYLFRCTDVLNVVTNSSYIIAKARAG